MPLLNDLPRNDDSTDTRLRRVAEALMILWGDTDHERITTEIHAEIGNLLHTIEAVVDQPDLPCKGDFVRFPVTDMDIPETNWVYGWIRSDPPRGIDPMAEIVGLDRKIHEFYVHELQHTSVEQWLAEG